jgi:hypothetical protein
LNDHFLQNDSSFCLCSFYDVENLYKSLLPENKLHIRFHSLRTIDRLPMTGVAVVRTTLRTNKSTIVGKEFESVLRKYNKTK